MTPKTIKVRKDRKTGDCYLRLSDFKDVVDITKVKRYSLEPLNDDGDNCMILKFYDAEGNHVEAGGKDE